MILKLSICLSLTLSLAHAKIVFENNDAFLNEKKQMLATFDMVMGPNGASQYVQNHERYILWTTGASVLYQSESNTFKYTELPSFTAPSKINRDQLLKIFNRQTNLDINADQIGGILIAHPYQGAVMYYRRGYLGHTMNDVDGRVAPAVIAYHELSHVKDYLINPYYFSDMASQFDRRYKNKAEKSATQSQNDFVIISRTHDLNLGDFRQSYGKNDLVMTTSPYEIP